MDFEQIEDKIIEEIKARVTYIKTVETYAGQLQGDIARLPVNLPAAFVLYGGSEFELVDGPNHREQPTFSIALCASNLRGRAEGRKGGQGAYDMVKDVLRALVNKDFGLDIERLRPLRVQLLFANATMTIYGVDLVAGFDTTYDWE